MPDLLTFTIGDESQEDSQVSFYTVDMTDLNFTDYNIDGTANATDVLQTAVMAFSRGSLQKMQLSQVSDISAAYPVDPDAQNEIKAQFRYRDGNRGKIGRFEIPCYNNVAKVPGSDDIDMSSTEVTNLQTALSSFRGFDGGTITLLSGKLVGRNIGR